MYKCICIYYIYIYKIRSKLIYDQIDIGKLPDLYQSKKKVNAIKTPELFVDKHDFTIYSQ